MSDPRMPFDDGSADADEALRSYHAELERSAAPEPAFRHELLGELEQPVRRRGPSNAVLGAIGLAAGLAGVAVLGVTLAFLRPNPTTDPAATGTPDATDVAIATSAPTEHLPETPPATATPTATPTATAPSTPDPSATPTRAPTPASDPTASVAPTARPATPRPTAATTARPTSPPTPDLVAGTWTTTAPIPPLPRPGRGGVADVALGPDDRLYAITWGDHEAFHAYDPVTDRWAQLAPPGDIVATDSFLLGGPDGLVYHFAGGATETWLWAYDPATDEWGERRTIPVDMLIDAVLGPDGRVLYIHEASLSYRTRTEVAALDLETLEIEVLAGIEGRYGGRVEMGADGRVYTIEGGVASYDPRTDTWREERQVHSVDEFSDFAAGPDGRLYLQMDSSGVQLLAWERSGLWHSVEPGPNEPLAPDLVAGADGRLYAIESVGGGTGAGAMFEPDAR